MEQETTEIPVEARGFIFKESKEHNPVTCSVATKMALLGSVLQNSLASCDYRLLKLRADNALYNTIAKELKISPFSTRKQLNCLISNLTNKHPTELFAFAWILDLFMDAQGSETTIKNLSSHFGLRESEVKMYILLAGDFLKEPVQHFNGRVYRVNSPYITWS